MILNEIYDQQDTILTTLQKNIAVSNQKFQLLHDMMPIGFFTLDDKGLITSANEAGAELLGISASMLKDRIFLRYVAHQSQSFFSEYNQRAFDEIKHVSGEIILLKRGGPAFNAKFDCVVATESPTPQLLMTIADKKNSTHNMAVILSNELKQPLSVIANYLHGSLRCLEIRDCDLEKIQVALQQSILQLNRATDIIARMNNFQYTKSGHANLTCLDKLIRDVIILITYETHDFSVDISYKTNNTIPKLFIHEIYIQQVLIHLTRNAIESMRDANIEDARLSIQVNQLSVNEVEISVSDNGPGFNNDNAHQLFQPHYTTKPYAMGLGLLVSRTIVEVHGGQLDVGTDIHYGACFKFTLPIKQDEKNNYYRG